KTLLMVKKEYLATALQAIEKEFGPEGGYLKKDFGLPLSAKKKWLGLYTKPKIQKKGLSFLKKRFYIRKKSVCKRD
ncbi:LOW QUALITY PROTEIN: predicted protein, partial [Enterococcus faecalis ARO1/DG]